MAQEDYVIADQTGVSFLSDLNDTLAAIVSNNSGATEPSTTYAYMWWPDTTSGLLKQRNAADSGWVTVLTLSGITGANIANVAAGNIVATDQQAAINELDAKKTVNPAITTITGSTVFTQSTNNIGLTGIGSIGLAVGDVIAVTDTDDNDKDFTVEVLTDADNIIVNQAHAGGTTSKSLVNETISATVTLVARAKLAPVGLGQGWVSVMSNRSSGTIYTNSTKRLLKISMYISSSVVNRDLDASLEIDGELHIRLKNNKFSDTFAFAIMGELITIDSTYEVTLSGTDNNFREFSELR